MSWIRLSFQAQIPWNLTLLLLLNKGSLLTTPNSVGVTNRLVLELYCVDLKLHTSDTCIVYLYPMFNLLPELLNVSFPWWKKFQPEPWEEKQAEAPMFTLISVVTDKQRALKNATGLFHSWSKDYLWMNLLLYFLYSGLETSSKREVGIGFQVKDGVSVPGDRAHCSKSEGTWSVWESSWEGEGIDRRVWHSQERRERNHWQIQHN